jgi:hypothetical protein
VKRFKKNHEILYYRLQDVDTLLHGKRERDSESHPVVYPIKISWCERKIERKNISVPKCFNIHYYHYQNIFFGAGLDARTNDYLRSRWASREDWWFHLEGMSGPHIILKLDSSGVNLDMEVFDLVASLMREHSSFKSDQIPLVYTQVANLRSVSGQAGMVRMKKEKRILASFTLEWRQKLVMSD